MPGRPGGSSGLTLICESLCDKVHPVIKKARMSWAAGGDAEGRLVLVHEGSEKYVA